MMVNHNQCMRMKWVFITGLALFTAHEVDARPLIARDDTVHNTNAEERAKRGEDFYEDASWCDAEHQDKCGDGEYCNVQGMYCGQCADICDIKDISFRPLCRDKCPAQYLKQQETTTVTENLTFETTPSHNVSTDASGIPQSKIAIDQIILACSIALIVLLVVLIIVIVVMARRTTLCAPHRKPGGTSTSEANDPAAQHLRSEESTV